jgi:KaiC/GvpD/RAD55 family RecA-like ATPase
MMPRIPTGIESLDLALSGGIPSGSLVLLVGESGAGKSEFCYTVTANVNSMREDPSLLPAGFDLVLPERIWYATFSRSEEGVLSDVRGKFSEDFYERFTRGTFFREFLTVPSRLTSFQEWVAGVISDGGHIKLRREVFSALARFLEREGPGTMVVFHTLTDFSMLFRKGEEMEFVSFLQSLREICREWNVTVFAILASGIFSGDVEALLISNADGVFSFEVQGGELAKRTMFSCKRMRGTTVSPEPFELTVTPDGVELTRLRTLAGR